MADADNTAHHDQFGNYYFQYLGGKKIVKGKSSNLYSAHCY